MKALGILVNVFLPGVGTLLVGKVGTGIAQILLAITAGIIFVLIPIIGWVIALPLGIGNWIWALTSAATPKPRDEIRYRQ